MISQSAEYSLRAVVCLALHPAQPLTTRQIADTAHIPPGYLAKILSALARAGLVTAQRGLNGGFILHRPAEQLTLLDVVQIADPSRRIAHCPLGLQEHADNLCALHRELDQIAASAEKSLASITIADLLNDPATSRPLCPHACGTTCKSIETPTKEISHA